MPSMAISARKRYIGGLPQAAINIYAKLTNVSGRRARMFEDVVTSSFTPEG